MEKPTAKSARVLFELATPIDSQDEFEIRIHRCYNTLKSMIAGKAAKECQELYHRHIASNPQQHGEDLSLGLLAAMFHEQDGQSDYFRDVVTISKDNLASFGNFVNIIISERLHRLSNYSVKKIFWIVDQLIKGGTSSAEIACSNLFRQTAGGDLGARNILMVEQLIELVTDNRSWVVNSDTFIGPTVVYSFMRLLADHLGPAQSALRQKEVDLVIGILYEKFEFALKIGKDFLRLLHNLIKIPEFEKLYQAIYNNPKLLHCGKFESPLVLLSTRTPRRLFQSRLTFEMERKISFFATTVKFGNQKRYQDWFYRQYLSTPESLSLRSDLIRYICTIIHPSNEVLCSDIIPRWAIIGWLLTTCHNTAAAAACKQALFFDWFSFDAKTDNIMNIEPAILVMYYSLRSHPNVTASLLDYLCRIPAQFAPKLSDYIRTGIKKSLQHILEKRVIQSLAPLFENPKHDPALKTLIRESFPEFCNVNVNDNGISLQNVAAPTVNLPGHSPSISNVPPVLITRPTEIITIDDKPIPTDPAVQILDVKVGRPSVDLSGSSAAARNPADAQQADVHKRKLSTKTMNATTTLISAPAATTILTTPTSTKIAESIEAKSSVWNGNDTQEVKFVPKINHNNIKEKKTQQPFASIANQIDSNIVTDESSSKHKGSAAASLRNSVNDLEAQLDPVVPGAYSSDQMTGKFELPLDCDDVFGTKVIYPFMTVKSTVTKETVKTLDESILSIVDDLGNERSSETRCTLMDKLISALLELNEQSITSGAIDDLAALIARAIVDDFTTRIFPSTSQDNESLEESILSPFFVLCRSAFTSSRVNTRALSLLAAICKFFDATGFLILYFQRVDFVVNSVGFAQNYITFCESAKRKMPRCLNDDLKMALEYDSELFCFLLPSIFSELASCGQFPVTSNSDLIHMVVSAVDPIALQELLCLCVTGAAKIINRDEPLPIIEASLNWESWEQYCFWKLLSAQHVPIENYISILPRLNSRMHAEAVSSIMLNLQKVTEPDFSLVQSVIDFYSKQNELFVTALLRFWANRTDIKELTKNVINLLDSRPPSPQAKRKGQVKAKPVSTLSTRGERIIMSLESIRQRAPRCKLFAQPEMFEFLNQIELLCNETQKKRFSELLSIRTKATKKKKLDKNVTA